MNFIRRLFGGAIFGSKLSEQIEGLSAENDENERVTLTYDVSVKIFSEFIDPSDFLILCPLVSKGWRVLARNPKVLRRVAEQLQIKSNHEAKLKELFHAYVWLRNPHFESLQLHPKKQGLIWLASRSPDLFHERHQKILALMGRIDVAILRVSLSLLAGSQCHPDLLDNTLEVLNRSRFMTRELFESPLPYVDNYIESLNLIPALIARCQNEQSKVSIVTRFLDNQRELPIHPDDPDIHYRKSGKWYKVSDLQKWHMERWTEIVKRSYSFLEREEIRQHFRDKWHDIPFN